MRLFGFGGTVAAAGILTLASVPLASSPAEARGHYYAGGHSRVSYAAFGSGHGYARHARAYGGYSGSRYSGGYLQCVPFARENTGIELAGNAADWWSAAQGVYERGARPEVGSILNFRATSRMHMGHVAVVSSIINARTVLIDHANWSGHGSVSHDTSVVDVSPGNDWTAVRVAISSGGDFGSIYPTFGFIYDRPDRGTMVANNGPAPTLAPTLNAAPRDLRPAADRMLVATAPQEAEEVAEAADDSDEGPRFRRVGRHLVQVHSRGRTITTSFAVSHTPYFFPGSERNDAAARTTYITRGHARGSNPRGGFGNASFAQGPSTHGPSTHGSSTHSSSTHGSASHGAAHPAQVIRIQAAAAAPAARRGSSHHARG